MDAFTQIRSWLVDEGSARGNNSEIPIIGAAICSAILREASDEGRRVTTGQQSRSDADLLTSALNRVKNGYASAVTDAERIVELQSTILLEDRISNALGSAEAQRKSSEHPIRFALWTGVAANFLWLLVSFIIVVAAYLINYGRTVDDLIRNGF
jgi:hypothetical protein